MLHSWELVRDFLFADTKTAMSLSLSFDVLKLNGDIQAALMEIRSRFVIVVAHIHLSHALVSFETVTGCAISPVELAVLETLTDLSQLLWRLVKSLLDLLVKFLVLLKLFAGLNSGWSRLRRQIEEVDVGAHEALRKQLDADALFVLFLL